MNQSHIIQTIEKMGILKKGRSTTEFVVMVIFGIFSGGISTGIIDLSPEQVQETIANAGAVIATGREMMHGDGSVMNGLFRIVALIIGGNVISSYIKSRGETKAAHLASVVQAMIKEMETNKNKPPKPTMDNTTEVL